jgi:hypothetical protein
LSLPELYREANVELVFDADRMGRLVLAVEQEIDRLKSVLD